MVLAVATFLWAFTLSGVTSSIRGDLHSFGSALGADLAIPPAIVADRLHAAGDQPRAARYFAANAFARNPRSPWRPDCHFRRWAYSATSPDNRWRRASDSPGCGLCPCPVLDQDPIGDLVVPGHAGSGKPWLKPETGVATWEFWPPPSRQGA